MRFRDRGLPKVNAEIYIQFEVIAAITIACLFTFYLFSNYLLPTCYLQLHYFNCSIPNVDVEQFLAAGAGLGWLVNHPVTSHTCYSPTPQAADKFDARPVMPVMSSNSRLLLRRHRCKQCKMRTAKERLRLDLWPLNNRAFQWRRLRVRRLWTESGTTNGPLGPATGGRHRITNTHHACKHSSQRSASRPARPPPAK